MDKSKEIQAFIPKAKCTVTAASAQNPVLISLPLVEHKGV